GEDDPPKEASSILICSLLSAEKNALAYKSYQDCSTGRQPADGPKTGEGLYYNAAAPNLLHSCRYQGSADSGPGLNI
ncbi:Hypothetical predicted protein, partial [Pelobates cultripes]